MNETVVVLSVVAAIASGTTLVLVSVGEILAERSGVMNLGIEGILLVGAVAGFWAASGTDNPWLGLLVALLVGTLFSLIHAVLSVSFRVNQIVSGLGLFILGSGLSAFLGEIGDNPLIRRSPPRDLDPVFPEVLSDLPLVGPILLGHDLFVYMSWLLVGAASFYLFRTRRGLAARAVGEDPATADAAGVPVTLTRYVHVLIGGAFTGLAGGYLSVALVGAWQQGFSGGLGWIAFAMVAFSGWRPWRALFASYAFGGLTNLGLTFQLLDVPIPSDFLLMMPFFFTLLFLVLFTSRPRLARKLGAPAALATPYRRESR
ncbi:MAG: ABC transporter permease [bacterium]|nr:ABC transporter permease [bacterium]MDE0439284.1 ABC transporter permease [bacterium]